VHVQVERQQHIMKSVEETHEAKHELVKKQQEIQRRNLKSTFEAERKKVTHIHYHFTTTIQHTLYTILYYYDTAYFTHA
jgi:uncharacterized membrane protein